MAGIAYYFYNVNKREVLDLSEPEMPEQVLPADTVITQDSLKADTAKQAAPAPAPKADKADETAKNAEKIEADKKAAEAKKAEDAKKAAEAKAAAEAKKNAEAKAAADAKKAAEAKAAKAKTPKTHTMEKGQSLTKISQMYYGTKDSVRAIIRVNKFDNPDNVPIGAVIKLP